jgi:YVTN family beta-propeller protein
MTLSDDGRYAYTTDNGTMRIEQAGEGGNSVSVIDLKERKRIAQISLGKYHRPHGIDLNPASGELLVTSENPDQLIVVDLEKQKMVRTYDTQGRTPHIVKASPDGQWAYVSNARSGNVAAIELATGKTILIPAGGRPEGSVLSKDGKMLYVVNRESSEVSMIDTVAKKKVGTIKTGKGPVRVGLSSDGKTLIYALIGDHKMGFADIAARKEIALVDLDGPPVSLHTSPDGAYAFAAAQEADTVYVVSIADRKLVRKFKTTQGAGPDPVHQVRAW